MITSRIPLIFAVLLALARGAWAVEPRILSLATTNATFGVDAHGSLDSITRHSDGRDFLASGQPAPILSVRVAGKLHAPDRAAWDSKTRSLTFEYHEAGVTARVRADTRPTHVALEILDVEPREKVELILWGPYPSTIGQIIGETVGVVRDEEFAIGIQTLNAKTLGGYPNSEDDSEGEFSADDHGRYPDLSPELLTGQYYRTDTARPAHFGSVLQAYARNRDRTRIIANWGRPRYEAPPYADGGVTGSKIALFACPAPKALESIGAIELAEGLPHPVIDGMWGKISPGANASYLIVDFSESNVDRAIEMTKRAGLHYLYHSSPFESWGHFKLKAKLFPHGWDGLRDCVATARAAGVRVGVHMLSNHLTTNDAYVTPEADPRLARVGGARLEASVTPADSEITVSAPDFFQQKSSLNAVRIEKELVRYTSVSTQAPWRLLDCKRGAFGTRPAPHQPGTDVSLLMDSDHYFLTDAGLAIEVAENFARLCNHAGILQISFDGIEGNRSTGNGQYGAALFTKTWFDALNPELRGRVINDASRPGQFNWHVYTRMNWGEPWYAGFRESQTLYRFKNQAYFERNLMPRMLGWFALRPDTSIEDAEWLLARAAGYNAGFALAASLASTAQITADPASAEALQRYGSTPAILQAIRQWEACRMAGAFAPSVRAALRDNAREFHLQAAGEGRWDLFETHPTRFAFDGKRNSSEEFGLQNLEAAQPLQWTIRSTTKEPVTALVVQINGRTVLDLKHHSLPPGGGLKYSGGAEASIVDATWIELGRVRVDAEGAQIPTGPQKLGISSASPSGAAFKIECRTVGPATRIALSARPNPSESSK